MMFTSLASGAGLRRIASRLNSRSCVQILGTRQAFSTLDEKAADEDSAATNENSATSDDEGPSKELPIPQFIPQPVLWGTKMKALVKETRAPGLTMMDMPIPAIGPNDVLIKVKKSAICGTDVHIYTWDDWAQATIPTPMTVGHEYVGEIVEVGKEVRGIDIGQRVTGEGHITCGYCRNCRGGRTHLCRATTGIGVNRPGSFAEYISLPAFNVFKLFDGISDEQASFMDALGNGVHTALSWDLIGEDVLITGAGPIGVMTAAICKHVGARHVVITDVNDFRLDLAKQCGASRILNVSGHDDNGKAALQQIMDELGMREGFDVGLEMCGFQAGFELMFDKMNVGGRVSLLGIPSRSFAIDWNDVIFKGLMLKGIYGREMFETWFKMQNMLEAGLDKAIAPVVTHRFSIDEYEKGFAAMISGQSGKVTLDWYK